jgi:hypothetical protein
MAALLLLFVASEVLFGQPAELQRLRKEKLSAIEEELYDRSREFQAGRGTLEFFHQAAMAWVETALSLCTQDSQRLRVLQQHYREMKACEDTCRARFDAGRMDLKDYLAARYFRVESEIRLAELRDSIRSKTGSQGTTDSLRTKPWAIDHAQCDAPHVDSTLQRRIMRDDARGILEMRLRNVVAGHGLTDFTLKWSRRWLEAERPIAAEDGDPIRVLEQHWIVTRLLEDINQGRYAAGRIPVQDLAQSREWRAEAELWLARSRKRSPRSRPSSSFLALDMLDVESVQTLRNAAAKAGSADPRALLRERLEAARQNYEARDEAFSACRGNLTLFVESAIRLAEVEVSLARTVAERRAALEQHCQRMLRIEQINRAHFEAGRIPAQFQPCRFHCLQAEEWLRQGQITRSK